MDALARSGGAESIASVAGVHTRAVQEAPVVNTGNDTRLVRKKQPDGGPAKVREFIPHDLSAGLGA
jgi:hypothetical protein